MFARLGRVVVRHPWRVIGLWVVAAVAIVALAPKLAATTSEVSFLPSHYQSVQASDLQKHAFFDSATPAALVVVERRDGRPLTPRDVSWLERARRSLASRHLAAVGLVDPPVVSANRLVGVIGVQMPNAEGQLTTVQTDTVLALRSDVAALAKGSGLRAGVTGSAAQFVDQQKSGQTASKVVAIATIGLILALLLLIFRSPVIALLPVIAIGVVSQIADGLIASLSEGFGLHIDSTVSTLLIVVLFGVGTDYVLFLMFRYRERLRAGADAKAAMVQAITRVGPAIATAAGAVIIAFLALTLSSITLFRSLGPALAIAVASTLVAGLTLIPAIVSLLGTKAFWPSKAWQREPESARFRAIGDALARHPGRVAATSAAVLIALSVSALSFHPSFTLNSGKTASTESAVFQRVLLRGYAAGAASPTDVYLESTEHAPIPAGALASFGHRLSRVRGVATVAAPRVAEHGTVADFRVVLTHRAQSDAAMSTVRGPLQRAADHAPRGTRPLIGGITSVYVDLQAAMGHDYALVFPVAAALILVILALLLRSAVAPWYLMGAVGLGFASTLGATVLVFQDARHESGLTFILPIVMYLFVVALGTDYNILMVSRLREEAAEGRDPRAAAAMAVRHAGPTIASAGLILAGTFASLVLAGGTTLSQMGFAISFGIAVAAFVMAMFLTPSLTALVGHLAWWPGHRDEPLVSRRDPLAETETACDSPRDLTSPRARAAR
ncbi:MAG: MMPL family transporter [Actinomycetota bacterium]|nr:MMPL family transporter [Actinomycetota bacterium]